MINSLSKLVRILRELNFDYHVRTYRSEFNGSLTFLVIYQNSYDAGAGYQRWCIAEIESLFNLLDTRLMAQIREVEKDRFNIFVPVKDGFSIFDLEV